MIKKKHIYLPGKGYQYSLKQLIVRKEIGIIISLLLIIFSSCTKNPVVKIPRQISYLDLDGLREKGKIIAVTDFNSTDYFIYKGEQMGFHFELLKSLAEYIGVNLEIVTENNINKSILPT